MENMNNIEKRSIPKINEGDKIDPSISIEQNSFETNEKETKDPFVIKRKIIPESWKENIDEIVSTELVGANRYFAAKDENIASLIENESAHDPVTYLRDLHERWDWHNDFYENLLEPSISSLLPKSAFELSPSQVENLIKIYPICSLVDQSTIVMSAGIKKCVENSIAKRYSHFTDEEKMMMITPPNESYWITYRADHLEYIASQLNDDPGWPDKEEKLLMKYHIGDRTIFNSRLKKFSNDFNRDANDIRKEIEELKISNSYKTKHFYLTLESPRLKAIRDLLEYDNIEEYRIMKNLIGISGFIFRKKIIEYLKETKLIEKEVGIYDLDDEKILELLSKLKEYRSEFFNKDVSQYEQTGNTCGTCCLMMAEKYFLGTPALEKQNENLIHNRSKSLLMEGDVFSLLANEAINSGLETRLDHSEKEYFSNEQKYIDPTLFKRLVEEYLAGINVGEKEGLKSETGVNIDSELLEQYLNDGYIVILAVMHNSYLHSILLTGHDSENFVVNNPLKNKKTTIDKKMVERISKTPIGSWLIAIKNNNDNIQKLMDKLPEFKNRASIYLHKSTDIE